MNTITSTAHQHERTVSFVVPSDIPLPKFSFNQRVEDVSNAYKGRVTGLIRGFEYWDLETSVAMGFEYEGWSYTVLVDEDTKLITTEPHTICEECDLRAIG